MGIGDVAAAEDLDLQRIARAAGLQQFVDQLFHREIAEARRLQIAGPVAGLAVRQHEMIHAANAGARVADAGRHAGSKHGDEHFVRILGDEILAGKHFNHPRLRGGIEEFAGCDRLVAVAAGLFHFRSGAAHASLR